MQAITDGTPKELLPAGGKPLAAHALEEAALAGSSKAVIIIRKGKESLIRELKRHAPEGLELVFEHQDRPLGECDAVALAGHHTGKEPFGVFYPDNVPARPGALNLVAGTALEAGLNTVALTEVDPELALGTADSGRVDIDRSDDGGYRVRRFLQKGPGYFKPRFPNEMRTCGIYAAFPDYLEYIEKARTRLKPGQELTDGVVRRLMVEDGVEFAGVPLAMKVFDTGNPAGYKLCLQELGP
jgi:UTP--glucose-1-phosphate uridylyltransferase